MHTKPVLMRLVYVNSETTLYSTNPLGREKLNSLNGLSCKAEVQDFVVSRRGLSHLLIKYGLKLTP
jgi:hypothetical protein